jgi:hypothetical protein
MFTQPYLESGGAFPSPLFDGEEFTGILDELQVPRGDSLHLDLSEVATYALENWLRNSRDPQASMSCREHPMYDRFRDIGMTDAVLPRQEQYDYLLKDGGSRPVIAHRLEFTETMRKDGVDIRDMTVFGGQRLRMPRDDLGGTLESRAAKLLLKQLEPWSTDWLESELEKSSNDPNPWERPFATEHEIALLALHELYRGRLTHTKEVTVANPRASLPGLPLVETAAQQFSVDDMVVRVLNAPALPRRFGGKLLPPSEARPTAASCFILWHKIVSPHYGAEVALGTHNPDIYRSWVDFVQVAAAIDRSDLKIEGIGGPMMPDATFGSLLTSLGKIITTFQNRRDGYDAPAEVSAYVPDVVLT